MTPAVCSILHLNHTVPARRSETEAQQALNGGVTHCMDVSRHCCTALLCSAKASYSEVASSGRCTLKMIDFSAPFCKACDTTRGDARGLRDAQPAPSVSAVP